MWKITYDHLEDKEVNIQSVDMDEGLAEHYQMTQTEFQMFDDDGELYYSGINYGDWTSEDGFRPLDEYGEGAAGCTEIKYKNAAGEWETL